MYAEFASLRSFLWKNSKSCLENLNDHNQPVGLSKCSHKECLYPDSLIKATDYGNDDQQWVVIYCVPLEQGWMVHNSNVEVGSGWV